MNGYPEILMFDKSAIEAAQKDALQRYPKEACGVISHGVYVSLPNISEKPLDSFELPSSTFVKLSPIDAVIHSHCGPRHGIEPTADDMENQLLTKIPFYGIVWNNGDVVHAPLWFGDFLLDHNMVGREFIHGVYDCYSLIRSWYWQQRKIKLIDFPRSVNWWKGDQNLYQDGFPKAGFVEVDADDVQIGDVLLMQIREKVAHHAAVFLPDGLMLHHLPARLSRREPVGQWAKYIIKHLRYEGAK